MQVTTAWGPHSAPPTALADLQLLAKEGVIRRYVVIERGGIRFGIFGLLGKEAFIYTNHGAVTCLPWLH